MREKWKKLLFILFFHSFCFFSFFSVLFSFIFPALEGKWELEGVRIFPLPFLNSFLFWEKNERINWKKSKEVLPLFLLFFLLFPPSSFQFFLLFGEGEKDKGNCPKGANPFLQEHFLFQQNQITLLWTKTFIVSFKIKPHSFRPCLPNR